MTDIKAVLFDRDDTLSLTDRSVYRRAALWVQERFGIPAADAAAHMLAQWAGVEGRWEHLRTLDDEERFWRAYAAELADRLGLGVEAGEELVREWPYERFLVPVPAVQTVLAELRALGMKIGVLSNTLPNVAATLKAIGIADLVDVAIASCTLGVHKPHPEAFTRAAELLGVPVEAVLFVDDRVENVDAARALGMQALLIDHSGSTPGALHDLRGVVKYVNRAKPAAVPHR